MERINKSFLTYVIVTMFIVSAAFVWAWVNPTANPPGGGGALSVDSSGNVGIGTISPGAKLEVVGTTKFGGIINAVSNRIINVGNPMTSTDAVNKDYVDRYGGVGSANPRLWGQGRPSSVVRASGGECDSSLNSSIKVSRSEREAHWDNAAAACPVGWWVCTEAERGTNSCDNAGIGQIQRLNCKPDAGADTNGQMLTGNSAFAWVSDVAPLTANKYNGRTVNYSANPGVANEPICSVMPVWCCAYK